MVEWLDAHHMGPYVFTFLSIVGKFAAIVLFMMGHPVLGGWVVVVEYLFDGMDGRMARVLGRSNSFGAFVDLFSDRLFRSFYLPALAFGGVIGWEWAAAGLVLDIAYATLSDFVRDHKDIQVPNWGFDSWRVVAFGAPIGLIQLAVFVKIVVGAPLLLTQVAYIVIVNRRMAAARKK